MTTVSPSHAHVNTNDTAPPSSRGEGKFDNENPAAAQWSGLETPGMKEAKCSLLVPIECNYEPKIKMLPQQQVLVHRDPGRQRKDEVDKDNDQLYVDFEGCTIMQFEPTVPAEEEENKQQQQQAGQQQDEHHKNGAKRRNHHRQRLKSHYQTMPVTLTVAGKCYLTVDNYKDFGIMMRTKEQSQEMGLSPNGSFDWPDIASFMQCPLCGESAPIPHDDDEEEYEYWLIFYPLLQITSMKGSKLTMGSRTICRLTCLECMESLVEGMQLAVKQHHSMDGETSDGDAHPESSPPKSGGLTFSLSTMEILEEAGAVSFLQDKPPRPATHAHVDDEIDAWTLYQLWEHCGAWEALQNNYRTVLSRSLHSTAKAGGLKRSTSDTSMTTCTMMTKERYGKKCDNVDCNKVHGKQDSSGDAMVRLTITCDLCDAVYYCSKSCRREAFELHEKECTGSNAKDQKNESRSSRSPASSKSSRRKTKQSKTVHCYSCKKVAPYKEMKKCSQCRVATYCSVDCQKEDWPDHKKQCNSLREAKDQQEHGEKKHDDK